MLPACGFISILKDLGLGFREEMRFLYIASLGISVSHPGARKQVWVMVVYK